MKPVEKPKAYRLKMTKEVAAFTRGKHIVSLRMPSWFPVGTKLFMVEYIGGETGRADVATVLGVEEGLLVLRRSWCWASGKYDDDLKQLSIVLEPDSFDLVTKNVIV